MRSNYNKTTMSMIRWLAVLASSFMLAGCVTETGTVYSQEVVSEDAAQSHVNAAMSYLRDGDSENALRHLRKALEINPKSATVHNGLAYAFQLSGENALAEKHYKTALSLDSSNTTARNNYAYFLYSKGDYKKAKKQLELVVQDTLYARRVNAFFLMGQCNLRLADLDGAEAAFARAASLDRLFTPAILEMADINLQKKKYPQAQRYYDSYKALVKQQTARSLYIGIQLAGYFEDEDALASYSLALKNLYPKSEEYVRYREESGNGQK